MAERRFSVRLSVDGGGAARAEYDAVGSAAKRAYDSVRAGTKSAAESAQVFIGALDQEERAFNALRAGLDPAFAATQRYEAAVEAANRAVAQGVATQDDAARVIAQARVQYDHASAASAQFASQMQLTGNVTRAAAAHASNLSFQINDIAMMMAAGQNPLVLAMQQGSQVSQVFGQMRSQGLALGPTLAGAFKMFLNPMTLATMGVIAFGGALVQWFRKSGDAADTLEASAEKLAKSMSRVRETTRDALVPLQELRKEWGAQAGAVKALREEQARLEQGQARLDLAAQARALEAMRATGGVKNLPGAAGWEAMLQEGGFGLQGRERRSLAAAFEAVDWGAQPKALAEDLRRVNEELDAAARRIAASGGVMTAPMVELSTRMRVAEQNARTLEAAMASLGATSDEALRKSHQIYQESRAVPVATLDAIAKSQRSYQALRAESDAAVASTREMIAASEAQAAMAALVARHGEDSLQATLARLEAERAAYQALVDAEGAADDLRAQAMRAWDATQGISTASGQITFNSAIVSARALADELGRALNIARLLPGVEQGGDPGDTNAGQSASANTRVKPWLKPDRGTVNVFTPGSGSSGGGGGGGGDPMIAEAKRIFDETRTAAEEYAAELADLNELYKLGYLDVDTYGRAMAMLADQFQGDGLKAWKETLDGIADSLAAAIVNGEDLGKVFANVVRKMAQDLLSSGLKSLLDELFMPKAGGGGGFLATILGAIFPKRADGGPVSPGQPYLVGERGPELYVPGASGMIVPNHRLGGAGGGSLRIEIVEAEGFAARVSTIAEGVSVRTTRAGMAVMDRALPGRVKAVQSDPWRV